MQNKKEFKDTTVGKLLFGAASVVNPALANVLKGVTSPQEAIAEITKSPAPVGSYPENGGNRAVGRGNRP